MLIHKEENNIVLDDNILTFAAAYLQTKRSIFNAQWVNREKDQKIRFDRDKHREWIEMMYKNIDDDARDKYPLITDLYEQFLKL